LQRKAQRGKIDGHRLQTAFQHQRARHARIVLEMSFVKPLLRRKRQLRSQVAPLPRSTSRIKIEYFIDEAQIAALDCRCTRMTLSQVEFIAEALVHAAFDARMNLRRAQARFRANDGSRIDASVHRCRASLRIEKHAAGFRQFLVRKEAGLPSPYFHSYFALHAAIVMKEEKP